MKVSKVITLSVLIGFLSTNAFAAQEVTKEEVKKMNLKKIGTVTTTGEVTAPMDAKREISKSADELGGRYFYVIGGSNNGKISASAEVYK